MTSSNQEVMMQNDSSFISEIRAIIEQGQMTAYNAAGHAAVVTYWYVGRRIVEEEQQGENRAEYGKKLIDSLSSSLMQDFGHSYNAKNLRAFRSFYLKFRDFEIWNARVPNRNMRSNRP